MNVLVVSPHPDDESIGCGGTLCLHRERGHRAVAVFLTSGELGLKTLPADEARRVREGEAHRAAEVLGLADLSFLRYPDWHVGDAIAEAAVDLAPVLARERPDIIYLPHPEEWHPDHRAVLAIVRGALHELRDLAPTLLTFEVWTPLRNYYHVENITSVMGLKLQAVRCHKSQVQQLAYARAVRGLNLYRGVMAGACRYAEIFETAELRNEAQPAKAGHA